MAFFLKSGDKFTVKTKEALDLHDFLPVGTYKVGFNDCSGQFYLENIEPFQIKGKLYGDTNSIADRILSTFHDRPKATGVLLAGEKGSGKTMLAKRISVLAAEAEIPTIVINQPWCGEAFNAFVQMIQQPVVMIFDEFEKVYSGNGKQEALLTLLDGVYPSKKLFIFTCNNKWKLDTNMQNRPGRIFYMLDYRGLDEKFILEYCEDNLKNKAHIPMVCATSRVFRAFNFDMLKALVEEMNRYGETPAQALKFLNARADFDTGGTFSMKLISGDGTSEKIPRKWSGNPVKDPVSVHDSRGRLLETFTPEHLKSVESRSGAYTFENKKNKKLVLTPMRSEFAVNFASVQTMGMDDTPPMSEDDESESGLIDADGGDY
mmetsp:Transcript_29717/g.45721  ORF Transcript_29717/g.45721 Transcript_29717/m.45721 type:complete len:375 (+) Transcript_29717:118-1242(+)